MESSSETTSTPTNTGRRSLSSKACRSGSILFGSMSPMKGDSALTMTPTSTTVTTAHDDDDHNNNNNNGASVDFSVFSSSSSFRKSIYDDSDAVGAAGGGGVASNNTRRSSYLPLKAMTDSLRSSKKTAGSTVYSDDDDEHFDDGVDEDGKNNHDDPFSILRLPFEEVSLAGRDSEMKILRKVLMDVQSSPPSCSSHSSVTPEGEERDSTKPCHLVLVSGKAGTGKSALVAEATSSPNIHTSTERGFNPLVAMGKFDQQLGNSACADGNGLETNSATQPFAAFSNAFGDLVHELVDRNSLSETGQVIVRDFIEQCKGTNVLQKIVPNLELLQNLLTNKEHQKNEYGRHPVRSDESKAKVGLLDEDDSAGSSPSYALAEQLLAEADEKMSVSSYSASTFGLAEQTKVFDFDRNKNALFLSVRTFVRTMCNSVEKCGPVVLVLEDIQWADPESLDLLTLLATDRESSGLVIILTFRENEKMDTKKSLQSRLDLITKSGVFPITDVKVGDLTEEAVSKYLENLLSMDQDEVLELASVVHKKTHGNAFFVHQFLKSLYDTELLSMNQGTFDWEFDVDQIRSNTSIADDIAGIMTSSIDHKLPDEAKEILFVASCFGSTFDHESLALIVHGLQTKDAEQNGIEHPSIDDAEDLVDSALQLCEAEGLLEKSSCRSGIDTVSVKYVFAHDYIQMAAFSILQESDRRMLQWQMGNMLLKSLCSDFDDESKVFVTADLLNRGYESTMNLPKEKRMALIKLNLQAGRKSLKSSAFSSALKYLRFAILCIQTSEGGKSAFLESHPKEWLRIHEHAAEAAFCYGDHSEMQCHLDEIIAEPKISFEDKLNAYHTLTRSLGSANKLNEAVDISMELLAKLGIKMPTKGLKLPLLRNLLKTQKLLDRYSPIELVELPLLEDKTMIAAMRIMDNALTYTYATNQDLMALLILKMTRRSVKYGLCRYSPAVFASYANIVGSVLGNLKKGHDYANVGLEINKRLELKDMDARTTFITYNFVLHWQDPLSHSFKPYLRGYQKGLECGDLENAMFCITYHCDVAMNTGRRLSLVVADFNSYTKQMEDFGLEYNRLISLVPWQQALNLMGRSRHESDPCVLTGEAMNQDEMATIGQAIPFVKHITNASRICLAVYFGDYETAWKMSLQSKDLAKTNLGQSVVWRSIFFEGLTVISLAKSTGEMIWKTRARKVIAKLESWVSKGNLNCVHLLLLLKAECAALSPKNVEATVRAAYDRAIASAARIGFLNDQALANERAGMYFCSIEGQSGEFWSAHYMRNAYNLYLEWEAYGKTRQLRKTYPELFPSANDAATQDHA